MSPVRRSLSFVQRVAAMSAKRRLRGRLLLYVTGSSETGRDPAVRHVRLRDVLEARDSRPRRPAFPLASARHPPPWVRTRAGPFVRNADHVRRGLCSELAFARKNENPVNEFSPVRWRLFGPEVLMRSCCIRQIYSEMKSTWLTPFPDPRHVLEPICGGGSGFGYGLALPEATVFARVSHVRSREIAACDNNSLPHSSSAAWACCALNGSTFTAPDMPPSCAGNFAKACGRTSRRCIEAFFGLTTGSEANVSKHFPPDKGQTLAAMPCPVEPFSGLNNRCSDAEQGRYVFAKREAQRPQFLSPEN